MKLLYSKHNTDRLEKYRLRTTIFEKDCRRFVKKSAATEEAKDHLRSVYTQTLALRKTYHGVEVVVPDFINDELVYPYISGLSWEEMLLQKAMNQDNSGFEETLLHYKRLIEGLQGRRYDYFETDEAFRSVFGVTLSLPNTYVLEPANVDMTFDNLISKDSKTNLLIDCEWVFPFPVPVAFVLYRSITQFWVKNHSIISKLYLLDDLFAIFGINHELSEHFWKIESEYFQVRVKGRGLANNEWQNYLKPNYDTNLIVQLVDQFIARLSLQFHPDYSEHTLDFKVSEHDETISASFVFPGNAEYCLLTPLNGNFLIELVTIEWSNPEMNAIVSTNEDNRFAEISISDSSCLISHGEGYSFFANNRMNVKIVKPAHLTGETLEMNIVMKIYCCDASIATSINQQRDTIRTLQCRLEQQQIEMEQQQTEMEQQQTEMEQMELQLVEKERFIASLLQSTSWKMTAFFRWIGTRRWGNRQ